MPDSSRYCQESLISRQKLHVDIPLEIAANIPRTNLKLLEGTTDSVRRRDDVLLDAQTMSEKQFAAKLSHDHHQHLEAKRTLKFTFDSGDAEQVEKALDLVGELTGFTDRSAQLLAWAINYIDEQEHECQGCARKIDHYCWNHGGELWSGEASE